MEEHGRRFGTAAAEYERGRPGYPPAAIEWLLEGAGSVVADVGAGTGKLTEAVLATGRTAIAIDPDAAMLERLRARLPDVRVEVGTAERLPLKDSTVDAVVLGQAWHWVEPGAASAEAARVLRSGGRLGLVWNIRDESVPWVAALTAIMHGSPAEQLIASGRVAVAAPFPALEERRFRRSRAMSIDDVLAMAASRSYLIALPQDERAAVLDRIRWLLETDPATAGRATVDMPYDTFAFRTDRP
jgi:SAM-dependent methyltransferase